MKLTVLTVGKSAPAWADAAVEDYARRLRRAGGVDQRWVKPVSFRGDVEAVRAAESAALLKLVRPRDRLVALDERGDALDTTAFVELIREARRHSEGRLLFALGGSYGHHASLRERAQRVVRLSSMVMAHDVARVVLFEQLYRSFSIMEGSPYHH